MRRVALLLAGTALAAGCGKIGDPRPPEPRGPLPPGKVEARQRGEEAVVAFTVPDPRGARESQQPVVAELLRVSWAPSVQAPRDPDAFRARGTIVNRVEGDPLSSGRRVFLSDPTIGELPARGVDWTLRYAVRVRDRRGRPSPLVAAVDLKPSGATGAPPPAPRAEPTADGVRLTWPSDDPEARFNVYRAVGEGDLPERPLNDQPVVGAEYVDRSVAMGETYRYEIRRVLADGFPYRESASSAPARVVAEDRFPPAAPQGLVAVQEGEAVRLFWNPNEERDVAGYRVYRDRGGSWEPVGSVVLREAMYLDRDVAPGETLEYRVTAIDRASPPNEGPPSTSVRIVLQAEPPAGGSGP